MKERTDSTPIKSTLVDITSCIGCHACQVACKQWNDRDGESTVMTGELGFQGGAIPVAEVAVSTRSENGRSGRTPRSQHHLSLPLGVPGLSLTVISRGESFGLTL